MWTAGHWRRSSTVSLSRSKRLCDAGAQRGTLIPTQEVDGAQMTYTTTLPPSVCLSICLSVCQARPPAQARTHTARMYRHTSMHSVTRPLTYTHSHSFTFKVHLFSLSLPLLVSLTHTHTHRFTHSHLQKGIDVFQLFFPYL